MNAQTVGYEKTQQISIDQSWIPATYSSVLQQVPQIWMVDFAPTLVVGLIFYDLPTLGYQTDHPKPLTLGNLHRRIERH